MEVDMDEDDTVGPFCRGCTTSLELSPLDILRDVFESVTSVKLPDSPPSYLCSSCTTLLQNVIKFKHRCLAIDKKLKLHLSEGIKETEDVVSVTTAKNEASNGEDVYVIVVEPKKKDCDDGIDHEKDSVVDMSETSVDPEPDSERTDGVLSPQSPSKDAYDSVPAESDGADLLSDPLTENGYKNINLIQFFKDDAKVGGNNKIMKLQPQLMEDVFDNSDTVDDTVTYSQEEIIVGGGEDSYEIVDCDIELNIDELERKEPMTVWQRDDGSFMCDCGEIFLDLTEFSKHAVTHRFTCTTCSKNFESKETYLAHMLQHKKSSSMVDCPYCKKTVRRNLLSMHINAHHNQQKPTCTKCNKTFATEYNRKRHMATHLQTKTAPKIHHCRFCRLSFSDRPSLVDHMVVHNQVACRHCGEPFPSKELLKTHMDECPMRMLVITDDNRFYCGQCNELFPSQTSLEDHALSAHKNPTSELLCSECGVVFLSKKSMSGHSCILRQNRLKSGKRYVCKICSKEFSCQTLLTVHDRVHTNERPYKCKKCIRSFKTKTHLVTHQLTHTHLKKFSCTICQKSFALKGNLVVHVRTHTGERPYVCDICNQGFIDSKYLKKHKMRRHATESIVW